MTSARILAQAIWRIHTQQSVGWIFDTLREEGSLPQLAVIGIFMYLFLLVLTVIWQYVNLKLSSKVKLEI